MKAIFTTFFDCSQMSGCGASFAVYDAYRQGVDLTERLKTQRTAVFGQLFFVSYYDIRSAGLRRAGRVTPIMHGAGA